MILLCSFIFVVGVLIGICIGTTVISDTLLKDGTISIDTSNPEKDTYLFLIDKPLDKLPNKKRVHLRITRQESQSQVKQRL